MTNNTSIVTLVSEVQLSNGLFVSKQSNGDVVFANFPSDASLETAQDFETSEVHFSPEDQAHILSLMQ